MCRSQPEASVLRLHAFVGVREINTEYESCRAIAAKVDVPLKTVYDAALAAARD